jgi:hypothetical protein
MNRWRVGEDRGSKETDRCPLTVSIERNVTFPPMGPIMVKLIDNLDIGELGIIDVLAALKVSGTPQLDVQPVKQSPHQHRLHLRDLISPFCHLPLRGSPKSAPLQAITVPSTKAKVPPPLP